MAPLTGRPIGDAPRRTPGPPLDLPSGTLDVWILDLAALADDPGLAEVLDADERARAERFRVEAPRRRYVAARGAVRHLLGAYVGRQPETLGFAYGPAGKPRVDPAAEIGFNLTHSRDVALCAVFGEGDVGIDVEAVRPVRALDRVVERHFSPAERDLWTALPEAERLRGFYRIWTRKEAVLKTAGVGLTRPLERVDSTIGTLDGTTYWLDDLALDEGFRGAVAATRPPGRIRTWSFARAEGC